ncbi:uncharacterized protein LOC119676900 [Teleopsis dalmanni]|uniref:uncharacterized protein LOC119676900 n=1 Tax=Teleopsis dalmanni TaxID=139649 RepID=UPI0018CCE5BE|nr:uncharacterized protein LOC119676900 [Teleopsis dalmanni]
MSEVSMCTFHIFWLVLVCACVVPTQQQQLVQALNSEDNDHFSKAAESSEQHTKNQNIAEDLSFYDVARKLLIDGDTETLARNADNLFKTIPYVRATIPLRIYECLRKFTALHCTKLFVLQKMEEHKNYPRTGNLTKDFMDQFFGPEKILGSLVTSKYASMAEKELNQRLVQNFQKFFEDRDIKIHFLPGIMVRIVPSKENTLKFSLKKGTKNKSKKQARSFKHYRRVRPEVAMETTEEESEEAQEKRPMLGKRKKKRTLKKTILQLAVPVMIMPAILMGSFLPFILPVLKMATIMTLLLNNSAFIAALIYAARTHVNSHDEQQQINYGHSSYH